jgi:uncharacterized phiE125 gp8 family phage protein
MITTVTTLPNSLTDLPLSLSEARDQLRVVSGDLDNQIEAALKAAVGWCETQTSRSLRVATTLKQSYSGWPCSPVRFDRQPVKSISSVKYYASGSQSTVDSGEYRLHTSSGAAGYLEWDTDFGWYTLDDRDDAVEIEYVAGYDDADSVPSTAKQAIRLMLTVFFGGLLPREQEAHERAAKALLASVDWGSYR